MLVELSIPICAGDGTKLCAALVAGALSKSFRDLLLYPLDTLKTQAQVPGAAGFKEFNFRAAYAGIAPVLLLSLPAGASYFGTTELIEMALASPAPYMTDWFFVTSIPHSLVAGAGASVISWAVRTPAEVLKSRAQAFGTSPWQEAKRLIQMQGATSLYRGYGATLARAVPFDATRQSLFEELSLLIGDATSRGVVAGVVAALVTQPLDAVKTRLQVYDRDMSWFSCVQDMIANDGLSVLWAGALERGIICGLSGALLFGTYGKIDEWVISFIVALQTAGISSLIA
eukprot:2118031-Pleurochrysis_carterae.AAC.2